MADTVHFLSYKNYRIGSRLRLSRGHYDQLIGMFEQPPGRPAAVLGGRTAVARIHLNGFGSMVIKHYRRGGWMRRVVRRTYLRWGRPRCGGEFDMLLEVRRLGVRAPEPIAYAYRGHLLYRCWLVTREIPLQASLADMGRTEPPAARRMIPAVADQIRRLIEHRIWHVDLHPGNVLVDPHDHVHLIDFDRARNVLWSPALLRRRYLDRWKRAVFKHGLPPQLVGDLEAGLERFRFE
jgi:3-deoxy-D-manno-octulosonic acid kinase